MPAPTLNPDEYTFGEAPVDSVDIVMLESFPLQVMVAVSGNIQKACSLSGVSRSRLYELLKKHAICTG